MSELARDNRWVTPLFFAAAVMYALVNSAMFYFDFPFLSFLPFALLVILVAVFSLDKIFWMVVLFTPLSLNLEEFGIKSVGLYLPTEPLLFGVLFLFSLQQIVKGKWDRRFMTHPLTIIILLQLLWIFITSVTSEDPVVSLKFFLVRLWFIVPCYFFASAIFSDEKKMSRMIWAYLIPLTLVVVYTVIHHATYGFEEKPAHWVMSPFFKDHTSYGAILALFIPPAIALYYMPWSKPLTRSMVIGIVVVLVIGTIFSYTRAAWVSLIGALGLFVLMWFRVKFSTIFMGVLAALFLFFSFYDQIIMDLERNKTDSSDDLAEHVQSISNISSDASNLERINRWNCALRMWQERPVFGWGPGTYQFYYAPFQHSSELTIISTNFGDLGNAHSEYLGPLAEQGVPGMALMVIFVLTLIISGILTYRRLPPGALRTLTMGVLLGIVTYFIHGVLNNYLDTDKASVPIWAFTCILVLADIRSREQKGSFEA